MGRKQKPLGIHVVFENNEDELIKITFSSCDIKTSPSLSKSLSRPQQVYAFLIRHRLAADAKTISEETGIDYKSVTSILSKYVSGKVKNPLFVNLTDGKWGAISNAEID